MARRPPSTDVLIALAVGVEIQVELLFVDAPLRDLLVARLAFLVLAGAVLIRQRAPVVAAALGVGTIAVIGALGGAVNDDLVGPFFAMLFVSYSIGAHAEGRALIASAIVLVGGSIIAVRVSDPPGGADDIFFALTIIAGGPLLLGRLVRARVRLNQALHEKALAAERDRAARAAGAVTQERARIAGELHHFVSDALRSMVGQAGAAEQLARSKPDVAERAFASVEETGREALTEIRGLLGVLRHDDEELALAPQPSLTHLRDLIARVRAAGLAVDLGVEGEQTPLPAGVDLTAYRVIQEALESAIGAPGAQRAAVLVRYGEGEVALEVRDGGGGQRHLLGVRERVALYGGDLVAEDVGGSGYAVRARLPLERVT
ncbi:MAG TPA: histidine kinase [Solirubrobacteraceae bacterium]|nr:histidine kinase [Solirubrobacteraceae bacterium]